MFSTFLLNLAYLNNFSHVDVFMQAFSTDCFDVAIKCEPIWDHHYIYMYWNCDLQVTHENMGVVGTRLAVIRNVGRKRALT